MAGNEVYSDQLNDLERTIVCARLDAVGDGVERIDFNLWWCQGMNWETVPNDGEFHALTPPGTLLRWGADLKARSWELDGDPHCSRLQIDWRYDCPMIASIEDVPGDQGLQVSLGWVASGYDRLDSSTPIHQYAVYRRIDPARAAGDDDGMVLDKLDGTWHYVLTVPACCEDDYAIVAPTLVDASAGSCDAPSTFVVRALTATPGVYFDSPEESGCSLDNLAPSVSTGVVLAGGLLQWDACPEDDFDSFTVYGSSSPELGAGAQVLGYTTGTSLSAAWAGHAYVLVAATDFAGNEGGAAVVEAATGAPDAPSVFRLIGAVPNPFNPSTELRFELPTASVVDLEIYDASGRRVRVLSRAEPLGPGACAVAWNGRDEAGREIPAGIYFFRLDAGRTSVTGRAVLVR